MIELLNFYNLYQRKEKSHTILHEIFVYLFKNNQLKIPFKTGSEFPNGF